MIYLLIFSPVIVFILLSVLFLIKYNVLNKSNKIYCKNCKYCDTTYYEPCCELGKSEYFTEKYINHKGISAYKWKNKKEWDKLCNKNNVDPDKDSVSCCNFNNNFNCKYYKRRWYKFWITEGK